MRSGSSGDLAGGVSAGILTIPLSIGYGLLALQPLGDGYIPYGILAGLLSAIVVLFAGVLLRGSPGLMYTPRSVVTLVMAAVVLEGVARGPAVVTARGDVQRTLALVFFIVLATGFFQALIGVLRLGSLIRYIPFPVMAGFQNASAILIVLAQVDALLGFRRHVPVRDLASRVTAAQPLTFGVGLFTAVVMWYGPRLTRRVPPVIQGILAGSAAYYALRALGAQSLLGSVVGPLPATWPWPRYVASFGMLVADREIWPVLLTLGVGALGLAIVSSLDVLLCVRVMDAVIGERSSGSRELARLGAGNMIAACFGGIPSGVNLGASVTNHRAGGRTRLAIAVAASVALLTMLLLAPVIALLPRAVIAGMLVVVGIQLFDPWSLHHLARLGSGRAQWRVMGVDLLVVVLVAASILVFDPVVGVGVGVALAVLFFLVRMSKSVVRRAYHGDTVRSRRARAPELMERLAEQGRRIVVFELEGPIFFGTAEGLAGRVDAAAKAGARQVILDLKRVNELDSTGARILLQINERLRGQGGNLLLSHPHDNDLVSGVLRDLGVTGALGEGGVFSDADSALESAEDRVLLADGRGEALGAEVVVERLSVLEGLSQPECAVVRALLARRTFHAGEIVIAEGSGDRDLFLISRGTASVRVDGPGPGRPRRLASFSAGTVFGEVALLDQQPRSATVIADEDVVCYVLSEEAFHRLGREHPAIAIRLLTNLGRELSRRLRRANAMISELEG